MTLDGVAGPDPSSASCQPCGEQSLLHTSTALAFWPTGSMYVTKDILEPLSHLPLYLLNASTVGMCCHAWGVLGTLTQGCVYAKQELYN